MMKTRKFETLQKTLRSSVRAGLTLILETSALTVFHVPHLEQRRAAGYHLEVVQEGEQFFAGLLVSET